MSWLSKLWKRLGETDKEYDEVGIENKNTAQIEAASKSLRSGTDYVEIIAGSKKKIVQQVNVDAKKANQQAKKKADKNKSIEGKTKGLARV
ncbi:MAG: hypothetical protein IJN50_05460 [Clostridia bacterium]|nr:hypothetical protein [Clostridia bacterium]